MSSTIKSSYNIQGPHFAPKYSLSSVCFGVNCEFHMGNNNAKIESNNIKVEHNNANLKSNIVNGEPNNSNMENNFNVDNDNMKNNNAQKNSVNESLEEKKNLHSPTQYMLFNSKSLINLINHIDELATKYDNTFKSLNNTIKIINKNNNELANRYNNTFNYLNDTINKSNKIQDKLIEILQKLVPD